MFRPLKTLALAALAALCASAPALAAEQPQEWTLVNPAGVIEVAAVDPAPRLTSLDGKTVVLRWNSKNNGNVFLDRLAELMAKRLPKTKIVKSYELDKSLNAISGSDGESQRITKAILAMKPDLVIAAQCD